MESSPITSKGNGEAPQEKEVRATIEDVCVGMEAFCCNSCSHLLHPPIFQGCRRGKLKELKCLSCSGTVSERSYGMERVVDSIRVPCPYAKHGCTERMAYYLKVGHEKTCQFVPCFCPYPSCSFTGPKATLHDHLTDHHKCPSTDFGYGKKIRLRVEPGLHLLCSEEEDDRMCLVNMVAVEAPVFGHAVAMVLVQPNISNSNSSCTCFMDLPGIEGHYQATKKDKMSSSSLSDGPPTDFFFWVPKISNVPGTVLELETVIVSELVLSDDLVVWMDDDESSDEDYEVSDA